MSFLNPGDVDATEAAPLADPCATFDCGLGRCEAVNLTPTCVCDPGAVAVGSFSTDGQRLTQCVTPSAQVPGSFYALRLPDLPANLPGGREVDTPATEPSFKMSGGGLCTIVGVATGRASGTFGALLLAALSLGGARRARTRRGRSDGKSEA